MEFTRFDHDQACDTEFEEVARFRLLGAASSAITVCLPMPS
jgi:hypothetical protein